jgi:hypothetical protein
MPELDLVAERAFWEARGLGAEFDRHVGQGAPASTPPAAQTPAAGPSAAEQLAGFLPPNVAEAARAAVTAGHWTPQQAKAALEGYDPKAVETALIGAPVERNEDLVALNRGGFVGAQDPSEIKVSYDPATIAHLTPAQFQKFDADIKTAMCEAGVPAPAAANVIRLIADAAYQLQNMQPAERDAWQAKQKADLVAVLGVEDAKAAAQYALETFNRIADHDLDLAENLVRTGVLHDAMLVTVLAQIQDIAALRAAVASGQSLAGIANRLQGA